MKAANRLRELPGAAQTAAYNPLSRGADIPVCRHLGRQECLPHFFREVEEEAQALGIAQRTLHRAKAALKVESKKEADGLWTWELPAGARGAA
jgi:hypothetical protein